jgi:hypothetical protein
MPARTRWSSLLGTVAVFTATLALLAPSTALGQNANNRGQKQPEPELPKPFVVKVTGTQMGKYYGKSAILISGVHAVEGKQVQLAVPPQEWNAAKYVPNENMAATVKALKPGEYIKVETEVREYHPWLRRLDTYSPVAGEELPGNYVFDNSYTQSEGGQEYHFVVLTKMAMYIDGVLPNVKDASRKMAPDPALVERLGKLKKGDVVEATLAPAGKYALVKELDVYTPPVEGTMGKVATAEEDGKKVQVVEIDSKQYPVAGKTVGDKFTPDARILAAAQRIRPGTAVLFRTREENGKTYLKSIEPAPKKKEEPAKKDK